MPAMQSLKQITDVTQYQDVPNDWLIAITDVKGSTKAIEAGRYKAVNTMAAVTITAVLNSIPNIEVPFLFGGDGASIVVPPEVYNQVYHALAAVKRLGRDNFELEVRAGIVPVKDVIAGGYSVKAGKINISDNFQQPVFTGGGLDYADRLIKAPKTSALYLIDDNVSGEADFTGFECRWDKHPASKGEVLSLLVKATSNSDTEDNHIYDNVLDAVTDIYGDAEARHPINYDKMIVATSPKQYHNELGWKQDIVTLTDMLKLMFWAIGGYLLWKYIDKLWDSYRTVVRNSTDHEKFDDMLRMTISGTAKQRADLVEFLEIYHQVGELAYGIHTADHSLMTCIVFDRFGRQVHFLDADAGGYAMAAKQLKQQLQMKAPTMNMSAIS